MSGHEGASSAQWSLLRDAAARPLRMRSREVGKKDGGGRHSDSGEDAAGH